MKTEEIMSIKIDFSSFEKDRLVALCEDMWKVTEELCFPHNGSVLYDIIEKAANIVKKVTGETIYSTEKGEEKEWKQ